MCDQQSLRSACAYAQSDQSLCLSFEYSTTVKLLTGHYLEFLSLKEAAQACISLHLSKCHIVEITCHGSIILHIYPFDLIPCYMLIFYVLYSCAFFILLAYSILVVCPYFQHMWKVFWIWILRWTINVQQDKG